MGAKTGAIRSGMPGMLEALVKHFQTCRLQALAQTRIQLGSSGAGVHGAGVSLLSLSDLIWGAMYTP
jgi:hypothetical protein